MRRGWHHRGYLSHLDHDGLIQHVVFRLADSLPRAVLQSIVAMNRAAQRRRVDASLDRGHGKAVLGHPKAAKIVCSTLRYFDDERYRLYAWCVMPNHVHVLVQPIDPYELGAIVRSWKAFSAAYINRALNRKGRLWAPDYFDRYMRDSEHFGTTVAYIESNPVRSGLCAAPDQWPYSSAFSDMRA
jgi:putative transposase